MDRIPARLWRLPGRLSPTKARLLIALSCSTFALAVLGVVLYDGLERAGYGLALFAVAFGNFAWGLGSLLPEERGGRAARWAMLPLNLLMFLGFFLWFVSQLSGRW